MEIAREISTEDGLLPGCGRRFVVVPMFSGELPSPAKRCSTGQSVNVGEGLGVREKISRSTLKESLTPPVGHPLPDSVRFCGADRSRDEGTACDEFAAWRALTPDPSPTAARWLRIRIRRGRGEKRCLLYDR